MTEHELPIEPPHTDFGIAQHFFPEAIVNGIQEEIQRLIFIPDNDKRTRANIHDRVTIFAKVLTEKLRMIGTNRLFLWNGSCYSEDCHSRIMNLLESIHNNLHIEWSESKGEEIMTNILRRVDIHDNDGKILNNYPDIIPFQNCYYHISTNTTTFCDPHIYFTYAFNIPYNPTAVCPRFLRFLAEVLPDPVNRRRLILFLAYSMTSTLKLQKAVICYGEGSNGKSTLFDLLKDIWGNLIANIAVQEIQEKFMKVEFRGKLLNIGPDLPETRIEEEGCIKECITENKLSSDEKFCSRTSFHNTTKHIFGCNEIPLPPLKAAMAFYRRWILICFNQTFKSQNDPDFDANIHKAKDINLLPNLIAEREGIMAYLVTLLPCVNELDVTDWKRVQNEWISHSESSLQYFVECEQRDGVQTDCSKLYENYKIWCAKKKAKISSRKHFDNIIAQQGYSKDRVAIDFGEIAWVYKGIGIPVENPENPFEGIH